MYGQNTCLLKESTRFLGWAVHVAGIHASRLLVLLAAIQQTTLEWIGSFLPMSD
jgi:hypothetical protein